MPPTKTSQDLGTQFKRYYKNITPVLKKPKVRSITSAVFSFLAISLFLWYAVRPTAATIIYLRKEIEEKTVLNQQMESKITSLIEAQNAYEAVLDTLPVLDQALPHQPDAIILARQLRNIAQVTQASISALQIPGVPITTKESTPGAKTVAVQEPMQDFTVSIVLSGSYPAIKAFMENLLSLRRITAIDSMTIKQESEGEFAGETLQMSLRLKTFYSLQ